MDEHLAQIRIPPLTDSPSLRLSSGRPLPRYQPQPGRELSSLGKGRSVPEGRDYGGGHHKAHSRDRLPPRTTLVAALGQLQAFAPALAMPQQWISLPTQKI